MVTSPTAEAPPGSTTPTVSVVLATFNERESLPQVLDRLWKVPLPPLEVLVVDDGSTDGTREFLRAAAREEPRLRPIWHEGKQTTLKAQCQGIADTRGRFVVVMDADLQHPPEVIPAMVAALARGAALVVGSRYAPGGSAGPRTWTRVAISRGAEFTAKLFLSDARPVSDPVSGLFAFRREVFRTLPVEWRGYKLLLFLLVMCHHQPVEEVGYRFEPRTSGASKVTQNSRFVRFFLTEVMLARRFKRMLARGAAGAALAPSTPGTNNDTPVRQQPL